MFEPDNQKQRYAMPWERSKRGGGGSPFERGLFKESTPFVFSSEEDQTRNRFQNYFTFKAVRHIQRGIGGNAVLRNRVLFILLCLGLLGFIIYHWFRT